jgi:hypothetical protein
LKVTGPVRLVLEVDEALNATFDALAGRGAVVVVVPGVVGVVVGVVVVVVVVVVGVVVVVVEVVVGTGVVEPRRIPSGMLRVVAGQGAHGVLPDPVTRNTTLLLTAPLSVTLRSS